MVHTVHHEADVSTIFSRRTQVLNAPLIGLQEPAVDLKQQLLEISVCDNPAHNALAHASLEIVTTLAEEQDASGTAFGVLQYRSR